MLAPHKTPVDALFAGEVGYLAAQIKSVLDARVGDTVTSKKNPATIALAGYEDVQPMVYCGLFPTDADAYQDLCVPCRLALALRSLLFSSCPGGDGGLWRAGGRRRRCSSLFCVRSLAASSLTLPSPPPLPSHIQKPFKKSKFKNNNPGARRWASCS